MKKNKFTEKYVVIILIICFLFILQGCGEKYYEKTSFINMSTKEKIIKVIEKEGNNLDESLLSFTTSLSLESAFMEITLCYFTEEDNFLLTINNKFINMPEYEFNVALLIDEKTRYSAFGGWVNYYSYEIIECMGMLNRSSLLNINNVTFSSYKGDEEYKSLASETIALFFKIGVMQIDLEFEKYNINFIETYF